MDLNKETRIQLNNIDLTFSDEKETNQNSITKVDKVADQIINAFIVKPKERMIDQEDQNDNISYEESEVRLIFMGITSATLLASISMILSIMALQNNSSIRLQIRLPIKDAKMKFLSPYVTFMHLGGEGHLFTLKQNPDANFKYDWELKLPRVPEDTGYFVFNDRNAIFVISSNSNQKMTMINGPNQHVTLAKSHIIDNFYYRGSILRIGNFVLVFGGLPIFETGLMNGEMKSTCASTTAIWSIKRQHWIQGPPLPRKIIDCYSISTGFNVNRTIGVSLVSRSPDKQKAGCIDAYTFSFDTFKWTNVKECFVQAKTAYQVYIYLTCATFFDRFSRLKVLLLISQQGWYGGVHKQTLLLDYQSMTAKELDHSMGLKGKSNCLDKSIFELI